MKTLTKNKWNNIIIFLNFIPLNFENCVRAWTPNCMCVYLRRRYVLGLVIFRNNIVGILRIYAAFEKLNLIEGDVHLGDWMFFFEVCFLHKFLEYFLVLTYSVEIKNQKWLFSLYQIKIQIELLMIMILSFM